MNFLPKKQKYKKQQKGKKFNKITCVRSLKSTIFNRVALKSLSSGRITSKQIESIYKCINKYIKKSGRLVLHIFPQTPITNKPIEVRMGKGKGNVSFWVAKIKCGILLCEIETDSFVLAVKALKQAQQKISIKTKIIKNYDAK